MSTPRHASGTPRQLRAILNLVGIGEPDVLAAGMPEKIVHWLYRILDTLDSKTSHLLQFAAMVLVAQVFLASTMMAQGSADRRWVKAVFLALPLATLAGTLYSLRVFHVKWPFLGWQPNTEDLVTEAGEVERVMRREFVALAQVCDKRLEAHNRVFLITIGSAWLLAVSVGLAIWALFG